MLWNNWNNWIEWDKLLRMYDRRMDDGSPDHTTKKEEFPPKEPTKEYSDDYQVNK